MPSARPWLKKDWKKVKGGAVLQTVYISNVRARMLWWAEQNGPYRTYICTLSSQLEHLELLGAIIEGGVTLEVGDFKSPW